MNKIAKAGLIIVIIIGIISVSLTFYDTVEKENYAVIGAIE